MAKATNSGKEIFVYADWLDLGQPTPIGVLYSELLRGKEVFSFSYDKVWLEKEPAFIVDPDLRLYEGPQYNRDEKPNFGIFTDSSPDRWGRALMERREALNARKEGRKSKPLYESDFLLGVFDLHRMGGLRYKLKQDGPFLDTNKEMAAPPFASIRTLEEASLYFEDADNIQDPQFAKWLNLLISPGSSLGGARPKASVADPKGNLWIAKFPSKNDDRDVGGWEKVVNDVANKAGVKIAEGQAKRFTQHYHTFLTKRFDRKGSARIHFASAMTMLGQTDGADAAAGISYLHLAEFIMRHGAEPDFNLEELWRRIVFNICVSNSDDHLRNHGFLLTNKGWILSPCFDVNPIPNSTGLSLNISEQSNALDLDLAREVAEKFRVSEKKREEIISTVKKAVRNWKKIAATIGIPKQEIQRMEGTFLE